LLLDEAQVDHVAPQLRYCVRWHGGTLRRTQRTQSLRRVSQAYLEAANAETGEVALHSVHDARALPHQALALTARPFRILILERGDRSHAAVIRLTAQPAEKGALEQLGIETIRLCSPVLT